MKFIYSVFALAAVISSVSTAPVLFRRSIMKRDEVPSVISSFQLAPGINMTVARNYAGVENPAGAVVEIQARDGAGVNPDLVPQFGITAGLNPTGTGNCDGTTNAAGAVIEVPCSCPPNRDSFIQSLNANVNAGHAVNNPSVSVSFPEDFSKESRIARFDAAIKTLQNLNGPGVGCPAASTTFVAQQAAIQNS